MLQNLQPNLSPSLALIPRIVTNVNKNNNKAQLTHSSARAFTLVQEKPAITLSQISEVLSWTLDKTAYILSDLEQKRLIRSEYVAEKKGKGRTRRLFALSGRRPKSANNLQREGPKLPSRVEGILSHVRKEGFDAKVEDYRKGEYLIRLRPIKERGSRKASSSSLDRKSRGTARSGYLEGARRVRPKRRRNKS